MRSAVALALLALSACGDPDDLSDGIVELPPELRELSAMVALNERTLACVQDELGSVFFVDLQGLKPVTSLPFGLAGDYEGIAVSGDVIWVLRSNGSLDQIVRQGSSLVVRKTYRVPADAEFEGLCLDAANQRLLVLPKGAVEGERRERDRRHIFAFDLKSLSMLDEPVLTLRVESLEEQIEKRGLPGPRRTTRKGKQKVELRLRGSELLAIPGGDLLLLSPKDHLLLRIGPSGDLMATQNLDPKVLPQPEAMALLADGRLLVGSEGANGPALIAIVGVPR